MALSFRSELSELPYLNKGTIEDHVGKTGIETNRKEKLGRGRRPHSYPLQRAFVVDYIVLGGGNAKLLEHLPPGSGTWS